mmetsp:Transcript_27827/g.50315  ORF Transcript_27827/g.50315 Transcript_27827/m.50315 type:complete len:189 (+) Transcript_27827:314-880(+)
MKWAQHSHAPNRARAVLAIIMNQSARVQDLAIIATQSAVNGTSRRGAMRPTRIGPALSTFGARTLPTGDVRASTARSSAESPRTMEITPGIALAYAVMKASRCVMMTIMTPRIVPSLPKEDVPVPKGRRNVAGLEIGRDIVLLPVAMQKRRRHAMMPMEISRATRFHKGGVHTPRVIGIGSLGLHPQF